MENKALEIIKTDYFESNRVDVVYINNKEYFIADQIARALEYRDERTLYRNILYRWKEEFEDNDIIEIKKEYIEAMMPTHSLSTLESEAVKDFGRLLLLSEEAIYVILINTRTEKSKKFKKWLTHEVLPSIRKKGYYLSDEAKLELELKNRELRVKELELKLEISNRFKEYAEKYPKNISAESQQALEAKSLVLLAPDEDTKKIIEATLPTIEKEYTATEIAKEASKFLNDNITAREIGKIAERLKIKRNPELCRVVPLILNQVGNAELKEVSQFRYKETAKEMILNYLFKKKGKQYKLR